MLQSTLIVFFLHVAIDLSILSFFLLLSVYALPSLNAKNKSVTTCYRWVSLRAIRAKKLAKPLATVTLSWIKFTTWSAAARRLAKALTHRAEKGRILVATEIRQKLNRKTFELVRSSRSVQIFRQGCATLWIVIKWVFKLLLYAAAMLMFICLLMVALFLFTGLIALYVESPEARSPIHVLAILFALAAFLPQESPSSIPYLQGSIARAAYACFIRVLNFIAAAFICFTLFTSLLLITAGIWLILQLPFIVLFGSLFPLLRLSLLLTRGLTRGFSSRTPGLIVSLLDFWLFWIVVTIICFTIVAPVVFEIASAWGWGVPKVNLSPGVEYEYEYEYEDDDEAPLDMRLPGIILLWAAAVAAVTTPVYMSNYVFLVDTLQIGTVLLWLLLLFV